jgi:Peptidase family M28
MRRSCVTVALLSMALAGGAASGEPADPVAALVARLDLEHYKKTLHDLTQFGDRREGTARNRAALAWIESQLRSAGCRDIERLDYQFAPAARSGVRRAGGHEGEGAIAGGELRRGAGGSRLRGVVGPTGVNEAAAAQPDAALRSLDAEPSAPGLRQDIYCTKVGDTRPQEMYIVSAHMDGIGWGEAANDDGSGVALVLELARVLGAADVHTTRSIRFALWNNEETGLDGSRAYVLQRAGLQGREVPAGSGRYPEPLWLGIIQHDMLLYDHGMPRADGTLPPHQRPEADVNVEFQADSARADESMRLAFALRAANERYAGDYPASVGPHMTHTDSEPFMDVAPAVSMRENERGMQIGAGWDPHWHQPTDLFRNFDDDDFRLGLDAAQTTLGAVARLADARLSAPAASPPASAPLEPSGERR